jgi:adenylate cyclase
MDASTLELPRAGGVASRANPASGLVHAGGADPHSRLPRKVQRRLAAVLLADVAGYARLMERDEAGTHLRVHVLRAELVEPAVESRAGRIIRSTGDGLLAHFASATEALRCAIDIQRGMADRNAGVEPAEQIRFRIGVNAADILFDDDQDIAGGGVNLAARLETLAEPGGICISRALRDHIQENLDVRYLDAGRHRVKNISRPVRVYRVLTGPLSPMAALRADIAERFGALWRRVGLASAAAALAALAVVATGHGYAGETVVRVRAEPPAHAGSKPAPRASRAAWSVAAATLNAD